MRSLTFDYHGVTRDFLQDTVNWRGIYFDLIDTGGISFKKVADSIAEQARQVAMSIMEKADLIVYVVDGSTGLLQEDREIARIIHKLGKPVVLVINKIDKSESSEHSFDFQRLGFKNQVSILANMARA